MRRFPWRRMQADGHRKLAIVPGPHRHTASRVTAVLATALVLATGGCATFSKAFGQREAVVQFQPGTPKHTKLRVRSACSHIPQVKAEALPTTNLASAQVYDVRYQVGGASDAHLAQLDACLQKFPSVVGVNFTSPVG